jgi:anaerobic ribonucleoside-triphosphate reductase
MQSVKNDSTVLNDAERQRCEVWTRVMGYHRPVSEFNPGKKGEHYERTHFVESKTDSRICCGVS